MLIDHVSSPKDKAIAAIKSSPLMSAIDGMTPDEIVTYVTSNTSNPASMRVFIVLALLNMQANR